MPHTLLVDWESVIKSFPADKKDIYFSQQYAKLYETPNEQAVCFKFEDKNNIFLFPILRREFKFNGRTHFDFETAYGYGGPISNTDDANFISEALQSFYDYCRENDFVCGFTRFHPLLQNSSNFHTVGQVLLDRQTVAIDLTKSEEEIWMKSISAKNRSAIKKSIANGLEFKSDYSFSHLDDFIELYNNTMNKLGADDFFVFDRDYYTEWVKNIPNSFLGVVLYEKKVISAAIFFYSEIYGHYHLAGSHPDFLSLNPNNFMIWEAAKELKKKNIKLLHLGGGSNGNLDNSLLSFKSRFSPLRLDFNIGKMIFNMEVYQQICKNWENNNPNKAVNLKNLLLKYKY